MIAEGGREALPLAVEAYASNVSLICDEPMGDSKSRGEAMSRPNCDDRIQAIDQLESHEKFNTSTWLHIADLEEEDLL